MNDRFLVIQKMKSFILLLDDILVNYPKKEYVIKDAIVKEALEILELMFKANVSVEKNSYQIDVLTKLSMLDFYFEKSYKRKYISQKVFQKLMNELTNITKMMYGWMKYDQNGTKEYS